MTKRQKLRRSSRTSSGEVTCGTTATVSHFRRNQGLDDMDPDEATTSEKVVGLLIGVFGGFLAAHFLSWWFEIDYK